MPAGETVYGVNTGFGKLSDVGIPPESLAQLQTNLVRSHAGGVGQPLSEAEARAMLLLRANVLAKGFSGCRAELVELLVAMLNAGVHPVIPEKGSVGASGDLAPLAHLALVAIGEGQAFYQRRANGGRRGVAARGAAADGAGRERGAGAAERDAGHDGCGRAGRGAGAARGAAGGPGGGHVARGADGHAGGV